MKEFIGDVFPVPRKLFFQSMHVAYSKALNQRVTEPTIIFGLHTLIPFNLFEGLIEDFSDAEFILMVRHPLRALASRFRRGMHTSIGVSSFSKFIHSVTSGGVVPSPSSASRWRAVKMEDLHCFPEQTLKKICRWTKLPWDKELLKSTVNGKQWWNEPGKLQVSGFSVAIASQKYEQFLPRFDCFRLNVLLGHKCAAWNYTVPKWNINLIAKLLAFLLLIFPFKMELIAWRLLIKDIRKIEKPIVIKFLLILRVFFGGFALGRIALFKSWMVALRGAQKHVQLI